MIKSYNKFLDAAGNNQARMHFKEKFQNSNSQIDAEVTAEVSEAYKEASQLAKSTQKFAEKIQILFRF